MAKKLNQLSVTMKQIAAVLPQFQNHYKQVSGIEVGTELVNRTPFLTGQARSNWRPGVGSANNDIKTGPGSNVGSIGEIQQTFNSASPGQPIFITNNLPYIGRLNEGWSKQAVAGYIQTAIKIGRQRARREIKKLFGGFYRG